MTSFTATGIVLNRIALGDNDRILTLYTSEYGKLPVVAKGARKAGSRLSGATELFTSARFLLAKGRSLAIVSQCEITESFQTLRHDLDLLARATYLCELLDHSTIAHDNTASASLYALVMGALSLLQRSAPYKDAVVHAFELHLMAEMGYAPVLEECARCGAPATVSSTTFSNLQGGILCREHRHSTRDAELITGDAIELLLALRDAEPDELTAVQPTASAAAEVARLLRRYIHARLDHPLKSTEFLDEIRNSAHYTG
jgi:DNA repair protein RecO (recombination protein O)